MIKIHSKVSEFANWEHSKTKFQSVPKKTEKLRVFTVKSTFLGSISSVFLALGFVQDSYQSDVRQSEDDRFQVVQKMGARSSGHAPWSG